MLWLLCYPCYTCMQKNIKRKSWRSWGNFPMIKIINSLYIVTTFNKLNAFNKILSFVLVVVNLNRILIIMIKWTQFKYLFFNVCVVLRAIKLISICKRNKSTWIKLADSSILVLERWKKSLSTCFNADNYIQLIWRIIKT